MINLDKRKLDALINISCDQLNLNIDKFIKGGNDRKYADVRKIISMIFCDCKHPSTSFADIGNVLQRNHSSIIQAKDYGKILLETSPDFREKYNLVKTEFNKINWIGDHVVFRDSSRVNNSLIRKAYLGI